MAGSKFEAAFRAFVQGFGGEIVREEIERSADYFFRQHNVLAELKCLVVDQTTDIATKWRYLVAAHKIDANAQLTPSDEMFWQAWKKVLLAPIENVIRSANQQIRATKERLAVPSAQGVVLIFNEGNPLHAISPQQYMLLVGEVIQKPKSGDRRFPHIQGAVYFSFSTVETFDEKTLTYMSFWLPVQVSGDSVEEIKQFQDDLKKGWYHYIEKMTGNEVVGHHRETGWPSQKG